MRIRPAAELSCPPGHMLSLLNHQLYQSTPAEKYATLFLGIYDGLERKITYSNAGHLPPIILSEDGSVAPAGTRRNGGRTIRDRSYKEGIVPCAGATYSSPTAMA